ncbi:MAG: sigma-54-dependent Fis family transcriptional regulator [Methylococcales bacterium]
MSTRNKHQPGNILIVDDTPANISMLFNILGEEGYKVLIAEDGESALKQAVKMPPDLILLDILMPGMDGFTTCQKFKEQVETSDIPIIFMSALSETEKKVNGFRLGAVDYITKPFQIEEVLVRVANHLNLQRLKNQLKDSEQRLSQTIEGAMDAIIAVAEDGTILLFNHAAEQAFQYKSAEILSQPVKLLFSESLNVLLADTMHQGTKAGSAIWIPEGHLALRSNGQVFPIEATLSSTTVDGKTMHTMILRDIEARQKMEEQTRKLQDINRYLQQETQTAPDMQGLVGSSQGLKSVMTVVQQVATTDATVLVVGETGTGKEVVVQAIHQLSQRKDQTLIKLNCAAIPENLIESELFGHEKGAFTGALARKIGRFELANGGTLFLDEIGEMELNLQTKLLRILQEGEFERVGGTQSVKVDVRIVTATHRNLAQCVKEGTFREDLFYRLNVFPIQVPPLRERKEDIEVLAKHFLKTYANKFNKTVDTIPVKAMASLHNYHWPGNVRELQHLIERAVILSSGSKLAFGDWFQPAGENQGEDLILTMEEIEYRHITKVLEATHWRISGTNGAAELLGLNASTLRSRINKLGIKRKLSS